MNQSMWIGNFGVVPLFCSLRLRALPLRAWRILRAVLVFIIRDGMASPLQIAAEIKELLSSLRDLVLSITD
jgi:hypothetical protein